MCLREIFQWNWVNSSINYINKLLVGIIMMKHCNVYQVRTLQYYVFPIAHEYK